jgi:hypothetical protein
LEEKILALLKTVNPGFTHVIVTPMDRTGNNKVFIVNSGSSGFFVKQFFESYEDKRNRFQAEISFIEYAHLCAPGKVPEMYAIDVENKFIIFENVVGDKLKVENINDDLILDAASFFSALNRPELKLTSGKKLLDASEACFSVRDHINLINQRIINLEKVDDNFNTASALAAAIICLGIGQSAVLTLAPSILLKITQLELPQVSISQTLSCVRTFDRIGGILGAAFAAIFSILVDYQEATVGLGIVVLALGLGNLGLFLRSNRVK